MITSIINNTLVWDNATKTGKVTACEGQQQVREKRKEKGRGDNLTSTNYFL